MRVVFWFLLIMVTAAMPLSASARPRDDVMAGAFRCAAVAESRQWLDCYYGAAQPVRAELGLSPAPSYQIQLGINPPRGGTATDMATRDQVMFSAGRCNALPDSRQWLDCFYSAAQPIRVELGLSPAPQLRVVSPPAPGPDHTPVAAQQFGLSSSRPSPAPNVDHVVSRMASYSFNRYGIFKVTLANGQVWRQLSGDTDYAHWNKPAATYTANITRGAFGSFNLRVMGNPGGFKVERVP